MRGRGACARVIIQGRRGDSLKDNRTRVRLTGLERFGLDEAAFRRLRNRNVMGYVHLGTYDLTPAIQRLPRLKRQPYMAARVDRWIKNMRSRYPDLSFQIKGAKPSVATARRWSELPTTLKVRGTARRILELASAAGVRLIYVTQNCGSSSSSLTQDTVGMVLRPGSCGNPGRARRVGVAKYGRPLHVGARFVLRGRQETPP